MGWSGVEWGEVGGREGGRGRWVHAVVVVAVVVVVVRWLAQVAVRGRRGRPQPTATAHSPQPTAHSPQSVANSLRTQVLNVLTRTDGRPLHAPRHGWRGGAVARWRGGAVARRRAREGTEPPALPWHPYAAVLCRAVPCRAVPAPVRVLSHPSAPKGWPWTRVVRGTTRRDPELPGPPAPLGGRRQCVLRITATSSAAFGQAWSSHVPTKGKGSTPTSPRRSRLQVGGLRPSVSESMSGLTSRWSSPAAH